MPGRRANLASNFRPACPHSRTVADVHDHRSTSVGIAIVESGQRVEAYSLVRRADASITARRRAARQRRGAGSRGRLTGTRPPRRPGGLTRLITSLEGVTFTRTASAPTSYASATAAIPNFVERCSPRLTRPPPARLSHAGPPAYATTGGLPPHRSMSGGRRSCSNAGVRTRRPRSHP